MPPRKPPSTPASVHQLRVALKGVRPPIWRRIHIASDTSLYQLHQTLQIVMGWHSAHLYDFTVGNAHYGEPDPDFGFEVKSARRARLSQVAPNLKDRLLYQYDFGDDWEHQVLVEKILPAEPGVRYPVCLKGKRACPPEDCGGIWGYAELLEILRNPDHEEYEERMEWLGGDFDPETFDVQAINEQLRRLR